MKKTLLAAMLALACGNELAAASDFGYGGGYYPGPAASGGMSFVGMMPLWTGFYAGANGGGAWAANSKDIAFTVDGQFLDSSRGPNTSGGFGGGQAGYNWRGLIFGPRFVAGIEADIQGAGIDSENFGITRSGLLLFRTHQSLDWFGTLRGRIGIACDPALFYFTGGFAFGGVQNSAILSDGVQSVAVSGSDTLTGYSIGGGIEYAFNSAWSLKAEYQYINLGSEAVTAAIPGTPLLLRADNFNESVHTLRVGLNWRVNSGLVPLDGPFLGK
jgi:outer membrane immunogenic protein